MRSVRGLRKSLMPLGSSFADRVSSFVSLLLRSRRPVVESDRDLRLRLCLTSERRPRCGEDCCCLFVVFVAFRLLSLLLVFLSSVAISFVQWSIFLALIFDRCCAFVPGDLYYLCDINRNNLRCSRIWFLFRLMVCFLRTRRPRYFL